MGNKKLQIWLPLLFALVMIAGMVMGYQLNNQGNKGFFSSGKRGVLQEAMDIIRLKYVDSVQVDTLQNHAIQEMMSGLDPHSVYFPPIELKEANEDLSGNFEGIGVEFNVFNDTVQVVYVITNGPSDKAGLQIGDKIISAGDSLLTRKNLTTDDIKRMIRGEKGSKIALKILRGKNQLSINVIRDNIPVSAIDAAYMIDKKTGYIKLNKFTEKSYREFMESLEPLLKQGMQQLIFDLRGNGGGFMNQAVEMADEFLDGEKLIVYTEGVNSKKREYKCKRPGLFEKGKLVLLVDELSASASEVLAGALQDWCRAKIIGRRTFGKGLVQEQYGLSDGSALRLTVARYYTPLGRSIQRSYKNGKKVYMDELWDRYSNGEMLSADSIKSHIGKKFPTNCNDTLYGGDGITPNVFVPLDTAQFLHRPIAIANNSAFNNYVYHYYIGHQQEFAQYTTVNEFLEHFTVGDDIWNGLLKTTQTDSLQLGKLSAHEKMLIAQRMTASLARYKWRNSGFYQVLNTSDQTIAKAITVLNQ